LGDLKNINFMPISIQAMVIKKEMIQSNGLTQVEGAVGQDSFFSYQLLKCAHKILLMNFPVHIYYRLRSNSVVNSINLGFFDKHLLLDKVQIDWLQKTGLLDDYMKLRFNYFFENWFLKKLQLSKPEEYEQCAQVCGEIFRIYAPYYDGQSDAINAFISGLDSSAYSMSSNISAKCITKSS
jgi:hypothetical protein